MRAQNTILLIASYVFYGYWDWRFLFLLIFSTLLDFFSGIAIHRSHSRRLRKLWLIISVSINLGFLAVFKYFNFFVSSFADFLVRFDLEPNIPLLNIILPVGISFYTFHGLSYVFDIYREKIKPTYQPVDYFLFVSFFPLLVAGPIERATHLLPQISKPRVFNYHSSVDGLRQILWGLFKKIVIADNCATIVNQVFADPGGFSGISLAIGAILFAFQIYGDFSGYSDIALGSARLFGFELLRNFSYPYFARDIAEFWRRWHISLTSWFKDYVYIPFGGNKGSRLLTVRNTFIVFLLSGFWHGANWTFLLWGFYHALLFMPLLLLNKKRQHQHPITTRIPTVSDTLKIFTTFVLVTIGWIIFRADSVGNAWEYFYRMINPVSSMSIFSLGPEAAMVIIFIFAMLIVEWLQKDHPHGLYFKSEFGKWPLARFAIYLAIILCIIWFSENQEQFIYFQF